jgi:hypothetical protein
MSEMIERVAKAIREAENPDSADQYVDMALAAIEAMREPRKFAFAPDITDVIWDRKIDAALK